MNKSAFIAQARETEGFWMSFHELVGDYPWLVKRMAAVRALAAGREAEQPRRHILATLMALFVPRLGVAGDAGARVERYLAREGKIPTLEQAGAMRSGGAVRELTIDPETAVLRVVTSVQGAQGPGALVFEPSMDENKRIAWECTAEGILPQGVPLTSAPPCGPDAWPEQAAGISRPAGRASTPSSPRPTSSPAGSGAA